MTTRSVASTTDGLETDSLRPSTTEGGPAQPLDVDSNDNTVAGAVSFVVIVLVIVIVIATIVLMIYLRSNIADCCAKIPYYSEVRDPPPSSTTNSLTRNPLYYETVLTDNETIRRDSSLNPSETNDTDDPSLHTSDSADTPVVNPINTATHDTDNDVMLQPNPSYQKEHFGTDSIDDIVMTTNDSYKKTLSQ